MFINKCVKFKNLNSFYAVISRESGDFINFFIL